jgi:lysozyme
MNRAALAILMLFGVGAAYAYRRAASIDQAAAPEAAPGDASWIQTVTENLPSIDSWMLANQEETYRKVQEMTTMIDTNANVRAFLEAIARAEGTAGQSDPYRVCYGYSHTIQSLADHPAITGEWMGKGLSDAMCRAAGYGPGCVSTAAGKYQITKPTWSKLKRRLNLPDFSPDSQDAAAIELLRESGALDHVKVGNVERAVQAARRTWASLPGAGYEQPERSLAWVQAQFQAAGGVLA